jgi:ribonuclease P protein component
MFPKESRLPRVVFTGKPLRRARFQYGSVSFFAAPAIQVAVVVSKKVARRAVDRNRIRRRAVHALKALKGHLTQGVVYYPTAQVTTVPYKELERLLVELCASR